MILKSEKIKYKGVWEVLEKNIYIFIDKFKNYYVNDGVHNLRCKNFEDAIRLLEYIKESDNLKTEA